MIRYIYDIASSSLIYGVHKEAPVGGDSEGLYQYSKTEGNNKEES